MRRAFTEQPISTVIIKLCSPDDATTQLQCQQNQSRHSLTTHSTNERETGSTTIMCANDSVVQQPPRTRREYLDAVVDAIARNAQSVGDEPASRATARPVDVYAVSDIHTDVLANDQLMQSYVERVKRRNAARDDRRSVIVVAGDVATKLETVKKTLLALRSAFDEVHYLPAGNHELWCAENEAWANGTKYPNDSIGKLWRLIDLCTECGVCCSPRRLSETLVTTPIYGWYDDDFCEDAWRRGSYSALEERFDAACKWPVWIRRKPDASARDSHSDAIETFMMDVNKIARDRFYATDDATSTETTTTTATQTDVVITYSHFLPLPKLYRGNPALTHVMGSKRLDADVRAWSASIHIFGHSHLNVDRVIRGVRYIQCALGYPYERWFGANEPKLIHAE